MHGPGSRGPAELKVTPVAATATPLPLESTNGSAPLAEFKSSVVSAMGGSAPVGGENAAAADTIRKLDIDPLRARNVESPPRVQGFAADAEKL